MTNCLTCAGLNLRIQQAGNLAVKRELSKQLLDHKLTRHAHEGGLPWSRLAVVSPRLESILERNN